MKPIVDEEKCMRCGACVGVCPENAMFLREFNLEIDDSCTSCETCVKGCPVSALDMKEKR